MYSIVINDLIANFVALSAARFAQRPLRRNLGTIFVIEEFKSK